MSGDLFTRRVCVCVPARDEAERLPTLLQSLFAQDWPGLLPVVVALNNTTDHSRAVVDELARRLRGKLAIHIDERTFAPETAHAGSARRRAMDVGVELLSADKRAVLLSADADARPPADWVRRNVEAIDRGVELVGGALVLDDAEAVSPLIRSKWDTLAAYWRAVRAIEDRGDPVPWDPPPRHGDHTGASLGVTIAAYDAVGGIPPIPTGEDISFVLRAREKGFRLAHPIDVWTRVSPRTDARASGGMAVKMGALANGGSSAMMVPSLDQWRIRSIQRREARMRGGDAAVASLEAEAPPMACDVLLAPASVEAAA